MSLTDTVDDEQLVRLVAHAADTHDRRPGSTVCFAWCTACKLLADLPEALVAAGEGWARGFEAETQGALR